MKLLDPHRRRVVDQRAADPALVSALAKGWRWRTLLLSGSYPTSAPLAKEEGVAATTVHRFMRLGYLAPDLIREILDGRQRPGLTLDTLCRADLPLDWAAQRRRFGAPPSLSLRAHRVVRAACRAETKEISSSGQAQRRMAYFAWKPGQAV